MRCSRFVLASILAIAVPFSSAFARDDATLAAAEELLELTGMETLLRESVDALLDAQLQQNPALQPHAQALRTFLAKHMSYESLKPDLMRIYAEAFTADELREIARFYQTPVGAKTVREMPGLMRQGSELGAQRVQANLPELEALIAESAAAQDAAGQGKKDGAE